MAKKSETGFDLLQRDINETSEIDSQELEFNNYEVLLDREEFLQL